MHAAAAEPHNLHARPCPACGNDDPSPAAVLRGRVYPFHRCRACDLLYAPRVLSREATRRLYTGGPLHTAYRDRLRADALSDAERPALARFARRLAAEAPQRGCAIDVGCGYGPLVVQLAKYFDQAIGLELDEGLASRALHGARVFCLPLEELDRPAGSVDLVVMSQVLEHVHDARTLVSTAARLLRPGGILYVGVPHGRALGLNVVRSAHTTVATHQHINLFSRTPLERLAASVGLEVRSIGTDDAVDLGAADWALTRASYLFLPALAVDKAAAALAARTHFPSRLGIGSHLEAVLVKPGRDA
jgi:SAM-dependent methyltransferase